MKKVFEDVKGYSSLKFICRSKNKYDYEIYFDYIAGVAVTAYKGRIIKQLSYGIEYIECLTSDQKDRVKEQLVNILKSDIDLGFDDRFVDENSSSFN